MPSSPASDDPIDVMLPAFRQRLACSVPFREDTRLLDDLLAEASPVLEVLSKAYQDSEGKQAGMHEGFALFNLLCRRAGLLAATPTASLALANAVLDGLVAVGIAVSPQQREDLLMIAVEGYAAGRDEQRERTLRRAAAESQVWCQIGPRCAALFLAGMHEPEDLEQVLERAARELFRAEIQSLLLDLSRLRDANEESARVIANLLATLGSLGVSVAVVGVHDFAPYFERLDVARHGAQLFGDFAVGLSQTLRTAGFELRQRRRFGDLLERVRSGVR
jgi:hypothetical protein